MKKPVLIMVLIVIVGIMVSCMLPYPHGDALAASQNKVNKISISEALSLAKLKNDEIVLQLKQMEYDYNKQMEDALTRAKEVDLKEARDTNSRINSLRVRDLIPEQIKHNILSLDENIRKTEKSYITTVRQQYASLLSAKRNLDMQRQRYSIDADVYNLEYIKHKLGLITNLEMEEATYNYRKARLDIATAVVNYENACRNFNLYIGKPIDTFYDEVEYEELIETDLDDLDYYLDQAMKNRSEIKSLQRQIELRELEKSIIETDQMYKNYTSLKEQHKNLETSISSLKLELERTVLDIKEEVKSAYNNVLEAKEAIEREERNLENNKKMLEITKAKYDIGKASRLDVKRAEINIIDGEYAIKTAIFNYNTQLMRLFYTAGLYSMM